MARFNQAGTTERHRPPTLRNVVIVILCSFFLCKPTPTSQSQITLPSPAITKASKDTENVQLKKLVDENQLEISNKLNELKKVVKPKIVYVKVYEKMPKKKTREYFPVERAKLELLGIDSDRLKTMMVDTIPRQPPTIEPAIKRPGFFKRLMIRLFHHKIKIDN